MAKEKEEKSTPKTPLQILNEKGNVNDPNNIRNILDLLETVSVIPTSFPKKFYDSIKIYENGATFRLYIYSQGSKTWRYVALT